MLTDSSHLAVSIIIPARNAEATLAETLRSVIAQTHPDWEAIVIDDGSTDGTAAVAESHASRDPRIRVVRQPHQGVSAARNHGRRLARHEWLLFLDADDWLMPEHLAALRRPLAQDPALDASYCGWVRVTPDGRLGVRYEAKRAGDLFPLLAESCVFSIHSCLVRRSLVEAVGGFDPSLRTCEDWDLWQRIARTGARFVPVTSVLARCRMRPDSASVDGTQMLRDGLRVLQQGHGPDPRVPKDLSVHREGCSPAGMSGSQHCFFAWTAGLLIGAGQNPTRLLELLGEIPAADLNLDGFVQALFEAVPVPLCREAESWPSIWPRLRWPIKRFLGAVEAHADLPGLAAWMLRILERMILSQADLNEPLTIGLTYGIQVDVTGPIPSIRPPAGTQRLHVRVKMGGTHMGAVDLPVCDGLVPRAVLADAIAAGLAWPILERFFAQTLFPALTVEPDGTESVIRRGAVVMGRGPASGAPDFWTQAHDRIGWTLFLQELWGAPDRPAAWFYDPTADFGRGVAALVVGRGRRAIEVSRPLPGLLVAAGETLEVVPTVAGAGLGVVTCRGTEGRVTPGAMRAQITTAAGFELCRVVVREAVLGRSVTDEPIGLRDRLRAAADAAVRRRPKVRLSVITSGRRTRRGFGFSVAAHRWRGQLAHALADDRCATLLPRRGPESDTGGITRRARLPAAATGALLRSARTAGELALRMAGRARGSGAVCYAPELVPTCAARQPNPAQPTDDPPLPAPPAGIETAQLPILMYHRVASVGSPRSAAYRVSPEQFERQLAYLRDVGFSTVTLEQWGEAQRSRRSFPGRQVLLTFDDGYADFATTAWPLLRRYGFTATVFLVAGSVGRTNSWDRAYGERVALMDWCTIDRLQAEGVCFGSHAMRHRALTALSPTEVVREAAESRAVLERRLGHPVYAFAYPYGGTDAPVQHLVGACGYRYGLTCNGWLAQWHDPPLALPRIEVSGLDSLEAFVRKLHPFRDEESVA